MNRRQFEKLNAPADFMIARGQRAVPKATPGLMTPSQFTVCPHPATSAPAEPFPVRVAVSGPSRGTGVPLDSVPTAVSPTSDPWQAIALAQQEILELRRENQTLIQQHGHKGAASHRDSRLDDDWRVGAELWKGETDRLRGEIDRLRGKVDTLKENAERQREEIKDKESKINRLSAEREELCAELSHSRVELSQSRAEMNNSSKQLADLQRECAAEREGWQKELQSSRKEGERLQREAQEHSLLLGETDKKERLLQQQLEDLSSQHQAQLQQLNEVHYVALTSANQTTADLQDRLSEVTQEVTSFRGQLQEVTSDRDELKDRLSLLNNDILTQSETLQNLRNYIGTLAPERGEEERLNDTVQRLEKEREALRLSVDLLSVRVNSLNDILAIQEGELGEQCDPVLTDCSKAARVLKLWREKVFALLVQLRSRDTQCRAEQQHLHNTIDALEEEGLKWKNQASVLQHSLQDKTAQLDLQRVNTEVMKEDLSRALEEIDRLKQKNQNSEMSLKAISETAHRLSAGFEERLANMDAAQGLLNGLVHRLTFATKRLDTVHGLLLRREALRKAQQATKPQEPSTSESCIKDLQAEVALLSGERDRLALELKRTPELIEAALSDLQQKFDREVGLLAQALSRSKEGLEVSETGRKEAEKQHKEQEGTIAELRAEALHAQRHHERELQEKLSEVEDSCAKQLRDMESQLNTARREHTKAVVALRQVQRQAERERAQQREAQTLLTEHTQAEITQLHTQLRDKDRDRNLLLAVVQEQGLMNEYKRMRRAAVHTSKALLGQQKQHQHQAEGPPGAQGPQRPLQREGLSQGTDSLLSVLGELQSLSAAVIDSSDSDEGEEGHGSGRTHSPCPTDTLSHADDTHTQT